MLKIKKGEHADYENLVQLAKDNYGDTEISNISYLSWQYELNPVGKAFIKIAMDEECIAAQYTVIPIKIKSNEQVINGTLSVNTITRDKYRGQGLFPRLASEVYKDCVEEGYNFTIGFPNPHSYPGFMNKLGFTDLGTIPLFIRPLKLNELTSRLFGRTLGALMGILQPIFRVGKNSKIYNLVVKDISHEHFDDINQLWNRIKEKYSVIQVRDFEFLKWKYLNAVTREYKVLGVWEDGLLKGYIVGRCTDQAGINCGMIVDFLIESESFIVGQVLLEEILKYFSVNNMLLAGALMLKNTEEYKILKKNKFYKCPKIFEPQPFPVIYKQHTQDGNHDNLMNIKHWFLTMGDYDVI